MTYCTCTYLCQFEMDFYHAFKKEKGNAGYESVVGGKFERKIRFFFTSSSFSFTKYFFPFLQPNIYHLEENILLKWYEVKVLKPGGGWNEWNRDKWMCLGNTESPMKRNIKDEEEAAAAAEKLLMKNPYYHFCFHIQ